MFNFFEELFAPGRKHIADEQKRLELTRVDLGTDDPGRGPIDLSSGKVTVRVPSPEDESASPPGTSTDTDHPPEPSEAPTDTGTPSPPTAD
ncbi:DUF6191 domain-containing protein [Streptomyces sp. LN785]|uniref:DUF6191 domain-containing protein n=1 Tax=Streptomyces sp. LN785 TaxID=3112983 RepID=UPI0037190A08